MQHRNRSTTRGLTTLDGTPASRLGLAAGPKQDPRCVRQAFAAGINYFFFYGPGHTLFIEELAALLGEKREQIIVATGSGSRHVAGLRAARRRLSALLGIGQIDVFFIEYVHPGDNPDVMFGKKRRARRIVALEGKRLGAVRWSDRTRSITGQPSGG